MRTRTLAQLITDVADRADIEVPSDSPATFVTKTTCTRWLNQSARRFIGMLVTAYGEDYYSTTGSISVLSGTTAYALPADFYQLDYLRVTIGGVRYVIQRAQKDAIDLDPRINLGWIFGAPPRYRLLGNQIVFTPTPLENYTVDMRYVGTLCLFNTGGTPVGDLTADTDYIDGVNGWEEWVVLDTAIKALARSDRDPTALKVEQNEIKAEIAQSALERTRDVAKVRDVYRGGRFGHGWGDDEGGVRG